MTAVLGGLLFVQPEGYAEAQRDVIRLSPDILDLQEQVCNTQSWEIDRHVAKLQPW